MLTPDFNILSLHQNPGTSLYYVYEYDCEYDYTVVYVISACLTDAGRKAVSGRNPKA